MYNIQELLSPFPEILKSAICPRSSGCFYWEWYSEIKVWALFVFIATRVSLLSDRSRIYIYIFKWLTLNCSYMQQYGWISKTLHWVNEALGMWSPEQNQNPGVSLGPAEHNLDQLSHSPPSNLGVENEMAFFASHRDFGIVCCVVSCLLLQSEPKE